MKKENWGSGKNHIEASNYSYKQDLHDKCSNNLKGLKIVAMERFEEKEFKPS